MKKCYKLKDCNTRDKFIYYYENINKVKFDLANEVIKIFELDLTLEESENKIGISNDFEIYFNDKFVKEIGLEKLFTPIASMDIRDKNGTWLGVWACLKRNRKQYKAFEKIKENYDKYDIDKMYKPRLYFILGNVTTHYLNGEMYIFTSCNEDSGVKWLKENADEIKMSQYYIEVEKVSN
ncbi:MAG: hypothetical protein ACRC7S_13050 [Cetobacterium sp.]